MPFDPTTNDLWLEIDNAMQETTEHLKPVADIIRRINGRWYRSDQSTHEPDPENFGYSFLSNVLPQLGLDNPQVRIEAARIIGHKRVAQAMNDGTNAWIREAKYGERIERVLLDFILARGILIHYLDEDTRHSRGTVTPAMARVSPRRFFIDPLAESPDEAAFMGHWYWMDLEDIRQSPAVNPKVVERLSGESSTADQEQLKPYVKNDPNTESRQRVKVYMVWLRDLNQLRFLTDIDRTEDLFEPRDAYGSPQGPYELFDAYPVSDQVWPLSPIVAVEDQNRDLNIHAMAMGRSAARRKSIALVESSNPELGDKLTNTQDGEIVPVRGITGQHVQIEVGGATPTQYSMVEYLRNRLDRVSGLTATVQGNVGAANTATEAQIAASGLNARLGYLQRKVVQAVSGSLNRIAWFLYHTEGIVIPVNSRDPYSGQQLEGLFLGGPSPTDEGATWDDFSFEVLPFSMQRESPEVHQQRVMGYYGVFNQIMGMAPYMPWVRWANVLRDLSDAFQMSATVDEWVAWEALGAFSQPQQTPPSLAMQPGGVPGQSGIPQSGGFLVQNGGPETPQQGAPRSDGTTGGPRPAPGGPGMPPGAMQRPNTRGVPGVPVLPGSGAGA